MKENIPKKIIKMKEIMRLFFKYEVDVIPVIDNKNKFKGFLDKNLIIQDATDSGFIEKSFFKIIGKYLIYPQEEKFLLLVSKLNDDTGLPVIDKKGNFLFLWFKKDLLNHYYTYPKEKLKKSEEENIYREILKSLPFNILLTDSAYKIIFINNNFLKEFDFEENILLNHRISKFFPNINKIFTDSNLFPKIHKMQYRHVDWFYVILNYNSTYIYIFSLKEEKFKKHDKEKLFSIDKLDIKTMSKNKQVDADDSQSLPQVIENQETEIIKKTLQENDWNVTKAATILNIPRQTLQYKISKYKII